MLARIEITGNGAQSQVIVNGVDLSHCVSKVEYIHAGQTPAEVRLTLIPEAVSISSVAQMKLSDDVVNCLNSAIKKSEADCSQQSVSDRNRVFG